MESARLESGEESREEAEFFAKLRELAANAEKRMQETQETTDTEWVRAYMDRVTVISGTIQMFFARRQELKPKYKILLERADELVQEARQASENYGPNEPPEDVKQKMMRALNVLN